MSDDIDGKFDRITDKMREAELTAIRGAANDYFRHNRSFIVIVDFKLHLKNWCTPAVVLSIEERALGVSVLCFTVLFRY